MSTIQYFPSQRWVHFSDPNSRIDIGNLKECIDDVRKANAVRLENIPIPSDIKVLIEGLKNANQYLPKKYRVSVGIPLIKRLERNSNYGREDISLHKIEIDAIRAVLLHSSECVPSPFKRRDGKDLLSCRATRAVQEMLCDLYDGWLEYEQDSGVKLPERGIIAPLHTWGPISAGPFTWTIRATNSIGLKTALVSFPLANSRGGLLAWTTLAHEVSGHDFLHADIGLLDELKTVVFNRIIRELPPVETMHKRISYSRHLAAYWSERIDETASDVLGVLNLGPSAGMGLIGYFRGLRWDRKLRTNGSSSDNHPADILRGLLAGEVISHLSFRQKRQWSQVILKETYKDYPVRSTTFGKISLAGLEVPFEMVQKSTALVANAIINTPLQTLEGRTLRQIRSWGEIDERHVAKIRTILRGNQSIEHPYPESNPSGYFAEYVVAGATIEALTSGANINQIFRRMIGMLETMHKFNSTWHTHPELIQHQSPNYFELRRPPRARNRSSYQLSSSSNSLFQFFCVG